MEKSRNKILAVLFTGVLMGALDISIVGPAIPSITKTIPMDQRTISWILSIYVLFNLTGISLFTKLSDLYGRRGIYIISIAIFAAGSLIVALSQNVEVLLTGRAIQGFGSSGIFPVASAVIGDTFPPEKRGRALGLIGAVFGLAFILGPVIAGVLLSMFTWHVLFLINLPIAAVLAWFSYKLLPSNRSDDSPKLDWQGILALGILLASFSYGINAIEVNNFWHSLLSKQVLPFFIIPVVLVFVLIYIERRAQSPVLFVDLFMNSQIRTTGIIALGTGLFQSAIVFLPDMSVDAFNISPSQASFMLLPLVIATAIGSPVSGRVLDRIGSRILIMTAIILVGAGYLLMGFRADVELYFYGAEVLIGLGLAILLGSSLRYIVLNEVKPEDRASAQGIVSIFVSIGQLTGAAFIGAITASHASTISGYKTSFMVLVVISVILLLLSVLLKSKKQEEQLFSKQPETPTPAG